MKLEPNRLNAPRIVCSLVAVSSLVAACSPDGAPGTRDQSQPVFWGDPSSQEHFAAATDEQFEMATATGILTSETENIIERNIFNQAECPEDEESLENDCTAEIKVVENNTLCPGQGSPIDWSTQSTLIGACTATMIRQNVFLTAAHCLHPTNGAPDHLLRECRFRTVIMRWEINEGQQDANRFILHQHLYRCTEVVRGPSSPSASGEGTNQDWAIFKVDKEVTGGGVTGGPLTEEREPLLLLGADPAVGPVPTAGLCGPDTDCDILYHYPQGLPLKLDLEGVVTSLNGTNSGGGGDGTFLAEVDAMQGSSGAALLSPQGRILGNLSKGPVEETICVNNTTGESEACNPMIDAGPNVDMCTRQCFGDNSNFPPFSQCGGNAPDDNRLLFVNNTQYPTQFQPALGDFDNDGQQDAAFNNVRSGLMTIDVRFGNGTRTRIPTIVEDVGLQDATSIQSGNLDGDSMDDLVVLLAGQAFQLLSNGTDFDLTPLSTTEFRRLSVVPGTPFDSVEAVRPDGSVTLFEGSSDGLVQGTSFTGLPSSDANDGKLIMLAGEGLDTVGANEARLKVTARAGDEAALEELMVEVFDGDNGGLHQFDRVGHSLKTCYQLKTDPCGDGGLGTCLEEPREPVTVFTRESSEFPDDEWATLFQGPHHPDASPDGNADGPFTYELHVYFSGDCSILPTAETRVDFAIADAFKIRSSSLVSHTSGEISFVGSDSVGAFGAGDEPFLKDTDFDGTFRFPIAVGTGGVEIQLKESDADHLNAGGVSDGANDTIRYRLLDPNGDPVDLIGENDGTPDLVELPSGNNDGLNDFSVGERSFLIPAGAEAGTWTWEWQNVGASNAVHIFAPFGSPTTYELMGAWRQRQGVTPVSVAESWAERLDVVGQKLPILLGSASNDGGLDGASRSVTTIDEAEEILGSAGSTLLGELARQLFVARLNQASALEKGQRLESALIYGATISVRTVFERADELIALGSLTDAQASEAERMLTLLVAVNLGEVNYQRPAVPFPSAPMADDDHDGIANVKDNCPSVANADQLDSDFDRVGDACAVQPVATCVFERSPGQYEAVIGYDNPLSFRSIPTGTRNRFRGAVRDLGQPTEFHAGLVHQAFRVPFQGDQVLRWELEGSVAEASARTGLCSGRELFQVRGNERVALFGTERVSLGHHVWVHAQDGAKSTVLTNGHLEIGSSTLADDAFAAAGIKMGRDALLHGSAISAEPVVLESGVEVLGEVVEDQFARPLDISWFRQFASSGEDVVVAAGQELALAPGNYGSIVVEPGGSLRLAGRYDIESLVVADRADVVADGTASIHVSGSLELLGQVAPTGDGSVVLAYFGSDEVRVEAPFLGHIMAPHAELVLGGDEQTHFFGAFFAREIRVRPQTIVTYAAP